MLGVARGLDKANVTGAAAAASPAVLGGGVPGGVVSMPLSSIIFLQTQKTGPALEFAAGLEFGARGLRTSRALPAGGNPAGGRSRTAPSEAPG